MKMSKLTPASLQDFGDWAFDDRSGCQSLTDDVRVWNEKHGHLLRLKNVWDLCDNIERCLELWEEHRDNPVSFFDHLNKKIDEFNDDRDNATNKNDISEHERALDEAEQTE